MIELLNGIYLLHYDATDGVVTIGFKTLRGAANYALAFTSIEGLTV